MSGFAFTVKVFGIFLLFLGLSLVFLPNLFLSTFGIPQTSEVWIRVVGALTFNVDIYYWYAAKSFFIASAYARGFGLLAFTVFAVLGLASPLLILFGTVDFFGGIWTFLALRSESKNI